MILDLELKESSSKGFARVVAECGLCLYERRKKQKESNGNATAECRKDIVARVRDDKDRYLDYTLLVSRQPQQNTDVFELNTGQRQHTSNVFLKTVNIECRIDRMNKVFFNVRVLREMGLIFTAHVKGNVIPLQPRCGLEGG